MASEAHVRAQYEALVKENKMLKTNIEKLDQENHDLKRSVYELTLKYYIPRLCESIHLRSEITGDEVEGNVLTIILTSTSGWTLRTHRLRPSALPLRNHLPLLICSLPQLQMQKLRLSRLFVELTGEFYDADADGDARVLVHKSTLRAHGGAVYTAKFSSCGRLLASGGFDCKVMLWDVTTKFNQSQLAALSKHAQLVIDVSWAEDSTMLVSGSYDHTVKLWDVEKSQLITSKEVDGLVQCVAFNMAGTEKHCFLCDNEGYNNQFFLGSSKCCLYMADARSDVCRTWSNDSMVNALHVLHDGLTVITGDSKGMLKTWDIRMDACLEELSVLNDPAGHAISHVHASPANDGGDDGRFIGVNSYDNILRVYDRHSKLISSRSSRRGSGGASDSRDDQLQLVCSVSGHTNKNWPIKSSFFRGDGYKYKLALPPPGRLGSSLGGAAGTSSRRKLTDGDGEDFAHPSGEHGLMDSSYERLLLATGSADRHIYFHEVTPSKHAVDASGSGRHTLVQKIDAHTDRVYCVNFHPTEPILASASADSSIKIWVPRSGSSSAARLTKVKS
ncbi:hypothetical protein PsorP6_001620 [Peronosclerospora sorghi]|uniref:Uncharacterized protein n=1 Tax=Peronosclerospora sorghi TaxID=230839 RepID=A0ACC0WVJ0_9STRA|nr:hypothetical protein PsorP6_001620 [Peronosclerospora sorghi]